MFLFIILCINFAPAPVELIFQMARMMDEKLAPVKHGLNFVLQDAVDPWERIHTETTEVAKSIRAIQLKPVSDYYGTPQKHYCMVLGKITHAEIRCAHIWPNATAGRGLEAMGLSTTDVSSPRNFLRLHKSLEHAFDHKRLTFIPSNPAESEGLLSLRVFVLDPKLADEEYEFASDYAGVVDKLATVHEKDFHYKFGRGKRPFLRLLAVHARRSFDKARMNGWIEDDVDQSGQSRANELARMSLGIPDTVKDSIFI